MQVYSSFNPTKHRSYYRPPFWKRRGFYFFAASIIALIGFIYWSVHNTPDTQVVNLNNSDTPVPATAKVVITSGDIFVKRDDWAKLNNHDQLSPGSEVKSSANSKATITLPDNSLIRLDSHTDIKLESFGLADVVIEQISGTAYHRIAPQSPAIYHVKHDTAEIIALGTGFNVTADKNKLNILVTESRVKTKIYENLERENIVNMRTIDEGYEATIDLSQPNDKMIDSQPVELSKLLDNEWLVWNKNEDQNLNLSLGVFANNINLKISEPTQTEFTTTLNKLTIKGETEAGAEIFVGGKEVKNDNGQFTTDINLLAGANKLEVVVKKDKKLNKQIFNVKFDATSTPLKLTATVKEKNIEFTWEATADVKDFENYQLTLVSTDPKDTKKQTIDATRKNYTWENLPDNTYSISLCALKSNSCLAQSNEVSAVIGEVKKEIKLTAKADGQTVNLTWTYSGPETKNLKVIINSEPDPVYPTNSSHTASKSTGYDWTDLEPGKYYFRVCALVDNQCDFYSNNAAVTISEQPTTDGVISLQGKLNGTQIQLYWKSIDTSKNFKVLRDEKALPVWPGGDNLMATITDTTDYLWSGLEVGKTYHFRVCENLGATCGAYSNEVVVSVK